MTSRLYTDRKRAAGAPLTWRGLAAGLTVIGVLLAATTAVFAQPITEPFAVPFNAGGELARARQADADRWVAWGEYYADMWEASAVASTMRYEAMAASFGAASSSGGAEQFALTSGVDPSGPVHGGGYIASADSERFALTSGVDPSGPVHGGGYIASADSDRFALTSGVDPSGPVHGGGYIASAESEFSAAAAIRAGANPSMNTALWYAPGIVSSTEDSFYAENPEILSAQNWAARGGSTIDLYVENPEILLVENWSANAGS